MKKNKLVSVLALSSIFATSVISASCEFGNGNGNGFSINTVNSRYEEKLEKLEKILPSVIENHNFIENASSASAVSADFAENVKLDLDSNATDTDASTAVDKTNTENVADLNKESVKQPETEITKPDEISGEININSAANAINTSTTTPTSTSATVESNTSSTSSINYSSNASELPTSTSVATESVINYPVQYDEPFEERTLTKDQVHKMLLDKNEMKAWNYYSHPKYALNMQSVSVTGDGSEKKLLSLIDNETKQVVEGVKWYQKTSYPEDLVFDANQDNDKTYLTLDENGYISGKKHTNSQWNTEVWAEYKGNLYRAIVSVGNEDEDRKLKEEKEARDAAKKIVAEWKDLSTLEKIIKAHEWLTTNVAYVDTGDIWKDQSAHSALVEKNAICTGYANGFNMLMHEMGIPSIMMTGNIASWRSVKHAWNLVEIDGKWYHVDTTSDRVDLTKGIAKDRIDKHKVTYNYFLMHDDDFSYAKGFYNHYKDRMGNRFRNHKNASYVSNVDEAMSLFDQKFEKASDFSDSNWLDVYALPHNLENLSRKLEERGVRIDKYHESPVPWVSYKKIRYAFKDFSNNFQLKEINASVSQNTNLNKTFSKYSLKVVLNPNEVSLDKGNFIVTNAMVNNVEKVSDGYIVYLDQFTKYEKIKVKLDIKKYGHKFKITGTNEFEFNVQKYETPQAKLIALSDKSIKLTNVSSGMEYRNNFGEWKDITSNDFAVDNVVLGSVSVRYKNGVDKYESDIQVIPLLKGNDNNVRNKVKVHNGIVVGVDSTMEFRLENQGEWKPIVTRKLEKLEKGTYQIRTKATENALASEVITVTVN
ncbi:MAG6410 family transglutaminase-related lipoprotein [Mycoplasmopsis agalactiae]|uniref:Transglutaminase-like domain-containing protein n=1 Tax=Mycoplasmopsis agalactiae TaxID=2110 RepID=D3VQR3_MYCAA|nr:transglutaminase-like domain-containing protein [Mycoplasmopsis agalactiae]KAB6718544.1 hypothetical protein E4L58_02275 [Mycoplasmopsis agalactiae]CBH40658.1 Hypothetical protein, predicted lipoprotein [Mycoplasmopsis agalactiae]